MADEPSAPIRVFGVPELLDNILSHILCDRQENDGEALRWALNLQKVNKTFQCHINGNTMTAKELYLAPKPTQREIIFLMEEEGYVNKTTITRSWDASPPISSPEGHDYLIRFHVFDSQAFSPVQSWGEMFLSQPPIQEIWMKGMSLSGKVGVAGRLEPLHLEPKLLSQPSGIKFKHVIGAAKTLLQTLGGKAERESVFFWARVSSEGVLWDREKASHAGGTLA